MLESTEHYPNIRIISMEVQQFIVEYIPDAYVIIFTRYKKHRDDIVSAMSSDAILISKGSGYNPLVVTDTCQDLEKAASDGLYVKFFNSGQDCAAPDVIIVHERVVSDFISKFIDGTQKLRVGQLSDPGIFIAPISRKSEIDKFCDCLYK